MARLDEAARQRFAESYAELWPGLVRLGRLLTGSTTAGEDIAQEAFLGLLRREFEVANASAYLRRSVVNLSINANRRRQRERERAAQAEPIPAGDEAQGLIDEIWPLIRRLPARQRAVLVLRYYEDLSELEIAAVLGCRPGTVKSLASRGLTTLRTELSREHILS